MTKLKVLALALGLCFTVPMQAQDRTPLERLDLIEAELKILRLQLVVAFPPVPPIATEAALDARIAGAALGEVIMLDPVLEYSKVFTLRIGVTLTITGLPNARMDESTTALPKFLNGIVIAANTVTLQGLEIRKVGQTAPIVTVLAGMEDVTLDQNRILGDTLKGAKRGVFGNGTRLRITRNWIDNCFGPYPGEDTQAILITNTPGPVLIDDNFLRAATEIILVGGDDPSSEANIPSDITITNNTLTNHPEHQLQLVSMKNLLEFKLARRVRVEGNILSYSWGQPGQTGYALVFSPRNQYGRTPWATVEDIIVINNDILHASGAISLLGKDSPNVSQRMSRITFSWNRFTDIDPVKYKGDNKLILVQAGPQDVTIDNNSFTECLNITSWLYFSNLPKSDGFVVTNNIVPKSKYGVFGPTLPAWANFVASGTLANNTVQ